MFLVLTCSLYLKEWMFFLKCLRVFPQRLTKEEGYTIFEKANRGDGADDDTRCVCMCVCACVRECVCDV